MYLNWSWQSLWSSSISYKDALVLFDRRTENFVEERGETIKLGSMFAISKLIEEAGVSIPEWRSDP